jgi:lipopolysaccharide/colanic/teichoic acid biosynthesis glycosyltransferase
VNFYHPLSIGVAAKLPSMKLWRLRLSNLGFSLSIVGGAVATIGPAFLASHGWGMSRQSESVVVDTALATLVSIVCSLCITRRLLGFPLMRSRSYVALTFATSFALMGVLLKTFKISFSSPQLFISMALMAGLAEGYLNLKRRLTSWHIIVVPGGQCPSTQQPTFPTPIKLTFLATVPKTEIECGSVVADLSWDLAPEWERFLASMALRGIPVYHVKQFNELVSGRVVVEHLRENTLGAIVPSLIYPQLKRMLDIAGCLLLLPVIGPIIAVAVILIKRESAGPAFYSQQRIGIGAKPFTVFKLRTMKCIEPVADLQAAFTQEKDPRITRIGRLLRKYHIDELPQVFNILRGDMSWIGPRPEAIQLAEWYEREVAFYSYRHIVRPGISGWAQVNQGNVGAIDAAREKLEYDFFYIKHFSFWMDTVIFVKTLRTILTGAGAR